MTYRQRLALRAETERRNDARARAFRKKRELQHKGPFPPPGFNADPEKWLARAEALMEEHQREARERMKDFEKPLTAEEAAWFLACKPKEVRRYVKTDDDGMYRHRDIQAWISNARLRKRSRGCRR